MQATKEQLVELVRQTPFMWPDSMIHLFIGGSGMHGATGDKPTDIDLCGVYIQPVELVLGIPQQMVEADGTKKYFDPDVQVWSPSGDHDKNGPGDIDLNLYSLRKWAGMAATGNTTALEFLFIENSAPKPDIWVKHVEPNREAFISARAGFHFLRFSESMLKRIKGEGQGKHGQRPVLEQEHGYDTKAAMHLIRVLCEGIELMKHGRITLPRPEVVTLKGIRAGDFSLEGVEKMYADLTAELTAAQAASKLPPEVDRARISRVITAAQVEHWGWQNEPMKVMAKAFQIATWWISQQAALNPVAGQANEWASQDHVNREILDMAIRMHEENRKNADKNQG